MSIYLITLILAALAPFQEAVQFGIGSAQIGPFKINIIDTTLGAYGRVTSFENLGPQVGNILNAHYFPAILYYQDGLYRNAYQDFTYVIDRATYLDGNANQIQYLATAYYLRGMVFSYHSEGVGRLTVARRDFEAALQLNPNNYPAQLELARVFSKADLPEQAVEVLRNLIRLKPDKETLEQAQKELNGLTAKKSK